MKPKGKLRTLVTVILLGAGSVVAQRSSLHASETLRPTLVASAAGQGSGQSADKGQGTLRVAVVTQSGGKVAGAELSIGLEGKSANLKAFTGRDGTYLSPQLVVGNYQLNVISACHRPWQGAFHIELGREQTVNVTLRPSTESASEATCVARSKQVDTDVQFSDSTPLKPGEVPGSVDAGGYSSQAQGMQMRTALGEWAGNAGSPKATDEASKAFSRGNSLLLQGDYGQAIGVFQQAAAQYPHSARLLLGLGVAYYSSGRYGDALDALSKAVDLNPSDRAAYFFLTQTYTASPRKAEEVLPRFERYAKREPQNAAAQYYYALCLWRSGAAGRNPVDTERVEQLLRLALALDPSLADAHFELGVVLAEQRQDAQALAEFERVIALEPGFPEAHYRAAQIYQRSGERERAEAELAAYAELRKHSASGDEKLRDDVRKLLLGNGGTAGN
ncbi:MAG TPA: tetratricopeptide repeat protein [Terriglobia bacterium]|nr:tetratricopeptide repeat protein [Terriglobia bacterium]